MCHKIKKVHKRCNKPSVPLRIQNILIYEPPLPPSTPLYMLEGKGIRDKNKLSMIWLDMPELVLPPDLTQNFTDFSFDISIQFFNLKVG